MKCVKTEPSYVNCGGCLWIQAIAAKRLPKDTAALGQRQAMAQKWVAMDRETKLLVRKVIVACHPQLLVRYSASQYRHAFDPGRVAPPCPCCLMLRLQVFDLHFRYMFEAHARLMGLYRQCAPSLVVSDMIITV